MWVQKYIRIGMRVGITSVIGMPNGMLKNTRIATKKILQSVNSFKKLADAAVSTIEIGARSKQS